MVTNDTAKIAQRLLAQPENKGKDHCASFVTTIPSSHRKKFLTGLPMQTLVDATARPTMLQLPTLAPKFCFNCKVHVTEHIQVSSRLLN